MPDQGDGEAGRTSYDVLGLKRLGAAVDHTTEKALDGVGAFLSRICLPAAEEFGLLLRDRVNFWRLRNLVRIAQKAERLMQKLPNSEKRQAHPRIAWAIVQHGSWEGDADGQRMWAGLLASSCTEDGEDDTNLIYIGLLSQLTAAQARVLNHACEAARLRLSKIGLVYAEHLGPLKVDELLRVSCLKQLHILDRDLDHLRSLGLIGGPLSGGGLDRHLLVGNITPTDLALGMVARCSGSVDPPSVYYKDRVIPDEDPVADQKASVGGGNQSNRDDVHDR